MSESLTVDDLTFEVRRSSRRKTVEVIVDRGGELIIAAPTALDARVMVSFVREKRFWLYTKIAQKQALRRQVTTAELVSGENFPYLGRNHRLLLVEGQDRPKLTADRFRLLRREVPRGRRHFAHWYASHALPWLQKRVRRWAPGLGLCLPNVRVLDLGFRWGSCGRSGTCIAPAET